MHGGTLTFTLQLPDCWKRPQFTVQCRGNAIAVGLGHRDSVFTLRAAPGMTEEIVVSDKPVVLVAGEPTTVATGA